MLLTFLTGGKCDFQEANLLVTNVHFEPWVTLDMYLEFNLNLYTVITKAVQLSYVYGVIIKAAQLLCYMK